eukprot:jgi/Ulvmu1/8424/UM043_0002.1
MLKRGDFAAGLSCPRLESRRSVPYPRTATAGNAVAPSPLSSNDVNQFIREGDHERDFVEFQAAKAEDEQRPIASYLQPHDPTATVDVCIAGCGPAGLALSADLAERGLSVCVVGPESKFTNNYGVWVDEFRSLSLEHMLDYTWERTLCYFGNQEKTLERAYGRVDRSALRHHLLSRCSAAGVTHAKALVTDIDADPHAAVAAVHTSATPPISARLATLAGGAVSAKFLSFESGAPPVAAQTAYGIQARVRNYEDVYDPEAMLFMDYRRLHSGLWQNAGRILFGRGADGAAADSPKHPNWNASHGTAGEAPSFLYAMPLRNGEVFLEETCLVARPTLPFSVLKQRLERRCRAMGIEIVEVLDEEYSYIPVGGPMPRGDQAVTAFGAAANLVHPATGYSIVRMLTESPLLAAAITETLARERPLGESAAAVWEALWPMEKRRQASFHVFGMELLATLEVQSIHDFFDCFFSLPDFYWRGFLASRLSSVQLLAFAMLTFTTCSMRIRALLMKHLFTNQSGAYMIDAYTRELRNRGDSASRRGGDAAGKP